MPTAFDVLIYNDGQPRGHALPHGGGIRSVITGINGYSRSRQQFYDIRCIPSRRGDTGVVQVQFAGIDRVQVARHFGFPYRVEKKIVPFIAVVGGEVNEIPLFFTITRVNLIRVHNWNIQHRAIIQIFFRINEITGRSEITQTIDELFDSISVSQRGHIDRKTLIVQVTQYGLAGDASVLNIQVWQSIPKQISFDVAFVIERYLQNAIRMIRSGPLLGKIPKLHFVGDSLVHQIHAESIDMKTPVGRIFEQRKSFSSRWLDVMVPVGSEIQTSRYGLGEIGNGDFHCVGSSGKVFLQEFVVDLDSSIPRMI